MSWADPKGIDIRPILSDRDRIQTAEEARRLIFPPDEFLDRVVGQLADKLGLSIAVVNFIFGDVADHLASVGINYETFSYAPQDSICTYVAASGRPLIFNSPATAPMLANCLNAKDLTYYAGAPIRFKDRVVGVVGVADEDVGRHNNGRIMRRLKKAAQEIERELDARNGNSGASLF